MKKEIEVSDVAKALQDSFNNREFSDTSGSAYDTEFPTTELSTYAQVNGETSYTYKTTRSYKRGDIVIVSDAAFDEKNSVQLKARPAVVIQNDLGNRFSKYLIVCYISRQIKKADMPTHILIDDIGCIKDSMIMAENIQTVGKEFVHYKGHVPKPLLEEIEHAIAISVGLSDHIKKLLQNAEEKAKKAREEVEQLKVELEMALSSDSTKSQESTSNSEVIVKHSGKLLVRELKGSKFTFSISDNRELSFKLKQKINLGTKEEVEQFILELTEALVYL